jgi:predicted nucleotidyltransferase
LKRARDDGEQYKRHLGMYNLTKGGAMTPLLQPVIAELKERLKELYGDSLERVVLFGSQARGDAAAGSDIDILVVLKGPVSPGKEISRTGEITSSISLRHDVVISCTFVSIDRYETEKNPLFLNVHREGVQV